MKIEKNKLGFYKISPDEGMKLASADKTMAFDGFIYSPTQDYVIEVTEEEAESINEKNDNRRVD